MMSIRSLADNMELPGWRSDWLAPPPSPPRAQSSARHDERGGGDFYLATSGDLTWPPVGTFSWPWTARMDSRFRTVIDHYVGCRAQHPEVVVGGPPGVHRSRLRSAPTSCSGAGKSV